MATFSLAQPDPTLNDKIDRKRYRKIVRFFAWVTAHLIWHDILLKKVMKKRVTQSRPERYRLMARGFRELAVEMGGVMIKLGQFLSTRVDVLPLEIVSELQGLQDEVPPEDEGAIRAVMQAELGDKLSLFKIETTPLAAASLGQTYRANYGDERVVIKVQRPEIDHIVRTDLAALRVVAKWTMRYKLIRRMANVPALMEEFAGTLWEELDYEAEARNAARFRAMFADRPDVYIPDFYEPFCTNRLIVMENVESTKIMDTATIEAMGIDRSDVANTLLDIYFNQVFTEGFFHADPHPGNLFVRPRVTEVEAETTPFELVFIDFGMVGRIDPNLKGNLTNLLSATFQRDTKGMTQGMQSMGFFLPDADLDRLAEAQEIILERIWGRSLLDLARPDMDEVQELSVEFRDILFDFPFQVPQDFVYLGRALGMLSGLATELNPKIDPWQQVEKYGKELLSDQSFESLLDSGVLMERLMPLLAVPAQIQRVLRDAEGGKLRTKVVLDRRTEQRFDKIERRVGALNSNILVAALLLSGTLLYVNGDQRLGIWAWVAGGLLTLWGMWRQR